MDSKRFAKFVVVVNCAVPAAILGWDAYHGFTGANPVNDAIKTTGLTALIFLILSLVVTPVRKLSGWNDLIIYRRTLGLYAFWYAAAHLFIYYYFDQHHNFRTTAMEIWNRWYLLVGLTSLSLMIPLAITSTNYMVRKLGPKRWKALHQLAYISVIAGCIHYYQQAKADKRQPLAFAGAAGMLLAYRWLNQFVNAKGARKTVGGVAPAMAATPGMRRAAPVAGMAAARPMARPKFWKGSLRVVKTFDETPDVRTFRFAAEDGSGRPFDFLPGQYLNLMLPIDGQKVNRSYTIASSPTRLGHCELTVKRETNGVASSHLHAQIKTGDVIPASAPAGKFVFTGDDEAGIVLIAGGVGITPMMSVIRYLTDLSWTGEIDLLYACRAERDVIFRDEIEQLRKRFLNFKPTITLTREESPAWTGPRGRISAEFIQKLVPNVADRIVHVCGPTPMMEPVMEALRSLGVPADRIRTESFDRAATGAAANSDDASSATEESTPADGIPMAVATDEMAEAGAGFAATFARSGKSVLVAPDQTVLDAAENAGISIEFDCRAGICGTCKTRLLTGRVDMESRDALSDAEIASGEILACQAHPLTPVTIDA